MLGPPSSFVAALAPATRRKFRLVFDMPLQRSRVRGFVGSSFFSIPLRPRQHIPQKWDDRGLGAYTRRYTYPHVPSHVRQNDKATQSQMQTIYIQLFPGTAPLFVAKPSANLPCPNKSEVSVSNWLEPRLSPPMIILMRNLRRFA